MIDPTSLPPHFIRAMNRAKAPTPSPSPKVQAVDAAPTPAPSSAAISFFVAGHPEPAGSKSSFVPVDKAGQPYRGPGGRIIVNTVDANPKAKDWKKTVAREARLKFTRRPHEGPVCCRFEFTVERPQCHFGTGRNAGKVKDSAPQYPTVKPDTLKLSRGTEDALTGIAWVDDAQVVDQQATKRYGETEGVQITIWAAPVRVVPQVIQEELPISDPAPLEPTPEEESGPFD